MMGSPTEVESFIIYPTLRAVLPKSLFALHAYVGWYVVTADTFISNDIKREKSKGLSLTASHPGS